MNDKYLINTFSLKHKWLVSVYENTSGFIHLSKKHISALIQEPLGIGSKDPQVIGLEISYRDNIDEKLWDELCDAFLAVNNCLLEYVDSHLCIKGDKYIDTALGVLVGH